MFNRCCVVSCASRRKDVNLYRFPGSETGLQKWLQCINCERLRSLKTEELRKLRICQKHFEKKCIASSSLRQCLRLGAYPTLFSQSEINSGIPQTLYTDTTNILQEHNYARKRKHKDHTYCKVEVAAEKRIKINTDSIIEEKDDKNTEECEELELPSTSQKAANIRSRPQIALRRRKRVIGQKKKLSPTCAQLYCEYIKSRKQLMYHKRAQRAYKFSKERTFEKLTQKLNPFAKKVLWMQIKQCTRKPKGRRFSNEEKLIALSILKQSPRSTINKILKGTDVLRLKNKRLPPMQLKAYNKYVKKLKNKRNK